MIINTLLAVAVFATGLGLGVFIGIRSTLAKKRLNELRVMVVRYQNAESLEKVFVSTLHQRKRLEEANLLHHVRVINAIQFVILWNWDLTTLLNHLAQTKQAWSQGWARKLHARVLALTIYESLLRIRNLLDKNWSRKWSLRRALGKLNVESEFGPDLDVLYTRLTAILDQHEELLAGVRNNAIGHRDQDVAAQLEWIRKANIDELEQLGWQLVTWTTDLIRCLTAVLNAIQNRASKSQPPARP